MHVSVRVLVGFAAVLQLGCALAQGRGADAVRMPVYRENGIVSSVPLEKLEKSKRWFSPTRGGAWAEYLSRAGLIDFMVGAKDTDPAKYPPVRCMNGLIYDDKTDKYFCDIPIKITNVAPDGPNKWTCEIGIPGVVYGNGNGQYNGEYVRYSLRWVISLEDQDKPENVSVKFREKNPKGIEVKNNHPGDKQSAYPEIVLAFEPDLSFSGKFKPKALTKAYYYDINLTVIVVEGNVAREEPCNPIDPVVVNTD